MKEAWSAPSERTAEVVLGIIAAGALRPVPLLAMNGPPAARNRLSLQPRKQTFPWPRLTSVVDPDADNWMLHHRLTMECPLS